MLTAEPERPVDAGTTVGVVKCAPLFLAESTLIAAASSVRYGMSTRRRTASCAVALAE